MSEKSRTQTQALSRSELNTLGRVTHGDAPQGEQTS
jgi:hypothetical protein